MVSVDCRNVRCELLISVAVIDACVPNPCLNGGNCSNLAGDSFACDCPVAWTGVRCESRKFRSSEKELLSTCQGGLLIKPILTV